MNVLKYRVSLDMFDTLSQTTIKAKKCDSACQIHITLTEKGKMYQIGEGCYATFNAKKSDGNFIYDNCTIEGNTIVYDFASSIDEDGNAQISACEGIVECEVTLYKANSEQLTSPRFTLYIDGTVYNGEEIISTPEANVLKKLINETNDLIDEVETKLENGDFKGDDYTLTEADKQEISQLATNDVKRYTDNIFGNAIKVTSRGKIISANDASPIEHSLDVKLSSEAITNFAGVEVARYGKNLFNMSLIPTKTGIINNGDNTITITGTYAGVNTTKTLKELCPALKVGDICVISAETTGANYINLYQLSNWNYGTSKTITQEMLDAKVYVYGSNSADDDIIKNIQVEMGTTATEFEEYKEPLSTYANADGTVEGLTSISPNMTVLVETDTSNMGGETDIGDGENLITGVMAKIQDVYDDNNDGSYTINKSVSTDMPIMAFKTSIGTLEAGTYTLVLGVATSDLYLQLNCYNTETGKEHIEQTDSTGKWTFTSDALMYIDSFTLRTNKAGNINLTVTPRLYKGKDKNVYIDLTYNADTKKYIDNELAKIKAELSAAILNS